MREHSLVASLINSLKYENEKIVMKSYNIQQKYSLLDNVLQCLDFEKLLKQMKDNHDTFYPYLYVHHNAYLMQKHREVIKYFYDLKDSLSNYHKYFGQMEKFALYVMMESYCLYSYHVTGENNYRKELR